MRNKPVDRSRSGHMRSRLINTSRSYCPFILLILPDAEQFPSGINILAYKRDKQYLKRNCIWNNEKDTK